jgi:hypothetical protein
MMRLGCTNGRIPATLVACLCPAFLLLSLSLQAATFEENHAARLERIGPLIAQTSSYSIHSKSAVTQNGTLVCQSEDSTAGGNAKIAEIDARIRQVEAEYATAHNDFADRKSAARAPIYADRTLSRSARDKKLSEISESFEEERRILHEHYTSLLKDLRDERRSARSVQDGSIGIIILHRPASRTETILPLQNGAPSNGFIAELNESVGSFIATCRGANLVYVYHYYQDAFRYGERDKPVISFRYNIEGNHLSLVACDTPVCRSIMATQGNSAAPRDNPDLTLAGFIEGELTKADNAGDYRKAFAYEAGRREGIVYKLDPYWGRYDGFDIARRIFEGEFGEYRNTPEFKAFYTGLATSYSKRCKAHVKQWQTFERNYDAYEGTDHNLDGSRTIHTSEQTKTYRIDARFGAHWAQFDSDLNRAVLDQGIFQGFGLVLGLRGEMETFLKTHACDSATVRQMTDNFIRAANGQPSVQQAGLRFAGAATESDAPTKTGAPPPPFTPVANVQEENETVNAAVAAFGGGGLFGEDWKTPTMSEKEFNREVDHVTGEGQDNFNRAARDAEQSLDELEEATREAAQAQSQNRQNLEQRLIELIKERNQTPENSQRYNDLQNTIEFTMQHMGITEEPTVPSENRPPAPKTRGQSQQPQQDSARQATADRRQRIRQIDQETDKKVQALIQAQHQTQVEEAEVFMKQITTVSGPERTRLLKDYEQKQRAAGEQLREQVQALRAEANERKRQL